MIVIRNPKDTAEFLAGDGMRCPCCAGPLAKWGYGCERTVRAQGSAIIRVRPQRLRCRACRTTHIVFPAALQPRRADTTEVIGIALAHKANGLGYRRIATIMAGPNRRCGAGCAVAAPPIWNGCAGKARRG